LIPDSFLDEQSGMRFTASFSPKILAPCANASKT
jgi:hypothetical protein